MNVARMQEMVLLSSICRTGGLGEGQGRGGREEKGAPDSVSMLTFLNVNCILNERFTPLHYVKFMLRLLVPCKQMIINTISPSVPIIIV